jgi:hypothetical protein
VAIRRSVGRAHVVLGIFVAGAVLVGYAMVTDWDPVRVARGAVARIGALSRPGTVWTVELGSPPSDAVVFDDVVVVSRRGGVEARSAADGDQLWDRSVDWSAVAGNAPIVVVGRRGVGVEALDAVSGEVRWRDPAAIGAWTFSTEVLTLSCQESEKCVIEARAVTDGARRWRVTIPGAGHANSGANSTTLGGRDVSHVFEDAVAAAPAPLPALLGVPVAQRAEVVDTSSGRRLRAVERPGSNARVAVLGGRILITTAVPKGKTCRFTIEAREASTGAINWRREGYDPHTVSGAGCGQRRAPTGDGQALAVTRTDGKPALLSLQTGQEVWQGAAGEAIIGINAEVAVVRAGDGKTARALDPATGAVRWERPLLPKAQPVLCDQITLLADRTRGRIAGYAVDSGRTLLDLRTRAEVIGCGRSGLLLARGRTVGLVTPR